MRTLLLTISLLIAATLQAQNSNSAMSGNWDNGASWNAGAAPIDNGDTIFIDAGHVVTLNTDRTYNIPRVIVIRGTLTLDHTLTLASGSRIHVEPGGMINSGNNGWRLNIGAESWGGLKHDPILGGLLTDVTLSISKVSFNGTLTGENTVEFSWSVQTSDEEELQLIVEKSHDGKDFDAVYETESTEMSGTLALSNEANGYVNYFRLRVVQKSSQEVSEAVKIVNQNHEVRFYPNPFRDEIRVNVAEWPENVELVLVDILGNHVMNLSTMGASANTGELANGIYFINVLQDGVPVQRERMVKR